MRAKLGPHHWAEVELTKDGVVVQREFPCIREVLYDTATGQVLATQHACFHEPVHLGGAPATFQPQAGQAVLRVASFPAPAIRRTLRDKFMDPDGFVREREVPDVEEDDLEAVTTGYRVNPATQQLERRP